MTSFNPETFLDATITEPSIKRPPIPAGLDFLGEIKEVKSRQWQSKDKYDASGALKAGIAIDVQIEVDVSSRPDVVALLGGVTKVILTDGLMLDTTPNGMIDNGPGKNGKLRRYREALDMNKPGDAFSFRAMTGRMLRVKIKHETYEGDVFDKVDSVARA